MEDKRICNAPCRCNKPYKLFLMAASVSGQKDVKYEDFHGHKLDRKLLKLLQEFE